MKLTPYEFEEIMQALDGDSDVNSRDRRDILKNMESCKNWEEFDLYLEKLEKRIERRKKRKNKSTKSSKNTKARTK